MTPGTMEGHRLSASNLDIMKKVRVNLPALDKSLTEVRIIRQDGINPALHPVFAL